MRQAFQISVFLLVVVFSATELTAQNAEISRTIAGELKMTFPSIYFKHNSTEYASMPYSADSCLRYIAFNFDKTVNDLVLWRDSTETEALTKKRIKKLHTDLGKYQKKGKAEIYSMGDKQKISRRTINKATDSTMIRYLLSLNSVLDVSKTRVAVKKNYKDHIRHPSIFCGNCWANAFHSRIRRQLRKIEKQNKAKEKKEKEKKAKELQLSGSAISCFDSI